MQNIQLNAGVLLSDFNPASPTVARSNIIGATTGGVQFSATPSFIDFGEDIDNCPKNMKELKKLDEWEVTLGGTFVTVTGELAGRLVGAADVTGGAPTYSLTSDTSIVSGKTYYTRSGSGTTESPYVYTAVTSPSSSSLSTYYELTGHTTSTIKARNDVLQSDFDELWWVGDYSDKNGESNGGFVAVHMLNALSTGGFSVQSADKEKSQFSFEFTGHYSISDPDEVPFEVYVKEGSDEPTT